MPKEGLHCMYLSVIVTDSVFKMNKNYYPQVLSEKCKYTLKDFVNKYIFFL